MHSFSQGRRPLAAQRAVVPQLAQPDDNGREIALGYLLSGLLHPTIAFARLLAARLSAAELLATNYQPQDCQPQDSH